MHNIWIQHVSIDEINRHLEATMCSYLTICITNIGSDFLEGTMPVDERTIQPLGYLHGGASLVLAETLGSIAGNMCVPSSHYCMGMEINANHIRSARTGYITGKTSPIHIGKNTQVWSTNLYREDKKIICTSRITLATHRKDKPS